MLSDLDVKASTRRVSDWNRNTQTQLPLTFSPHRINESFITDDRDFSGVQIKVQEVQVQSASASVCK